MTEIPICTRAILLPCPCCGAEEVNVSIHLGLIDDNHTDCFTCNQCDAEFSIATVREIVKKWTKLLTWLATAPDLDAE